jgi:D-alanyl-D-alanine carboxypeptidase (penicillin-binding protein 5/6)
VEHLELPRPSPGLDPEWEVPSGGPSYISAASAILVDGNGEVLFARNPDEPRPPASVTKILTALVVLERGRLNDAVTVSPAAAKVGGFQLGLRHGQRASLQDLLAAVLIMSANDAAVAVAEHVGGSVGGFADMMNAAARRIGMTHSRFANPHGLHEADHYTTAQDLARLTRVALDQPEFARLVRTREATITIWKSGRRGFVPQARVIRSHNRLLGRVAGADGVKTGYTDAAGRCLVASASRGSERMIAVLLNDPRRWSDATTLLEFGFEAAAARARALRVPERMPWREAGRG